MKVAHMREWVEGGVEKVKTTEVLSRSHMCC